jgi:hypothetical protein
MSNIVNLNVPIHPSPLNRKSFISQTRFWSRSVRSVDSRRTLTLAIVLVMTANFGLLPVESSQAQEKDDAFVINDVIAEESDSGSIKAQEVALDPAGNRYVFGPFTGKVEFGEGRNAQTLNGTDSDLFVAKYDARGNLQWVQEFETSLNSAAPGADAAGIELDKFFGNLYVAGHFLGQLNVGSVSMISGSEPDGFIAQLNPQSGAV